MAAHPNPQPPRPRPHLHLAREHHPHLHNLDDEAHQVALRLPHDDKPLLTNLLDPEENRPGGDGTHTLTLDAYGYRWYRLGGLDYALSAGYQTTDGFVVAPGGSRDIGSTLSSIGGKASYAVSPNLTLRGVIRYTDDDR